jgi:hypothetical protein
VWSVSIGRSIGSEGRGLVWGDILHCDFVFFLFFYLYLEFLGELFGGDFGKLFIFYKGKNHITLKSMAYVIF